MPAPAIIDCAVDTTPVNAELRSLGVETVFGYLDPLGQTGKALTPTRARALASAGLRLGLVSEGWGDFAHNGISSSAGVRDAANALRWAPLLGAPKGATIYFAVDVDATWGQIFVLVTPYFRAIKLALAGHYAVGVYGSGAVCETMLDAQLASAAWLSQSRGWLRSAEFSLSKRWTLQQGAAIKLAGIECDGNVLGAGAVLGDFVPYAEALVASR